MSNRKKSPARTTAPKLRKRGDVLLTRFTDACFMVQAVGDGNDRKGAAARANYTRARNALVRYVATLEAALLTLANTHDFGPLSQMDEPSSVGVARTALGLSTLEDLNRENSSK